MQKWPSLEWWGSCGYLWLELSIGMRQCNPVLCLKGKWRKTYPYLGFRDWWEVSTRKIAFLTRAKTSWRLSKSLRISGYSILNNIMQVPCCILLAWAVFNVESNTLSLTKIMQETPPLWNLWKRLAASNVRLKHISTKKRKATPWKNRWNKKIGSTKHKITTLFKKNSKNLHI